LADINRYAYSNNGASIVLSRTLSHSLRGEFSIIGSQYEFKTRDNQEAVAAYEHEYKMGHYELRADLKHLISDVHLLEYGAGIVLYKLNRGNVIPWGAESLRIPVMLGTEQSTESAIYFTDSWDATNWLNITTGLRYSVYTPLGPQKVYTYFPGSPVDLRYINDSINFKGNSPIKWYHEPDIRLAINIETDINGSVKLAFNRTHQNLFMLNNTLSIAPNTQWKLSDYHLKPSESKQVSAGIFRIIGKSGFDASVETFYKQTKNYPEFKDGANFLDSPHAETSVLQGTQQAYGMEFMLKRSNRKFEGWLAYTWSRTIATVNGAEPWNKINKGEPFPANFDIPNAVNLIMNYHMSRRITFSSVLVYQTGKPVTYPVSTYYIDGVPYLDYSSRNAYRIPDYFRTDISITIEGSLKKNKLLHSSLSINVYNLTGRANPFSVYFRNEKGRIKSYQYSVIGVPILTATWIFKLGNYASD
jgi:outer membrane receptor protein involved in Fe transport